MLITGDSQALLPTSLKWKCDYGWILSRPMGKKYKITRKARVEKGYVSKYKLHFFATEVFFKQSNILAA